MSDTPLINPTGETPGRWAAISRAIIVRVCIAAALILAAVIALESIQSAFHLTFDKPPMKLTKPLALVSTDFARCYVTDGPDVPIPEDQIEVLGTNEYLMRAYRDVRKRPDEPTGLFRLNLNYYPSGSSAPHVPEICWVGSGKKEASVSRVTFNVPNVHRVDGSVINLRVRMISFLPPGETENPSRLLNVAYVFNVNGDYAATPQEVISHFWKASNKHAFNTKIEVTIGSGQVYCSQAEAQTAVAEFLRAAIPEIEKCLPGSEAAMAPQPAAENLQERGASH